MTADFRNVDTDQAGARGIGFHHPVTARIPVSEEFEVRCGAVYKHWPAKTVTEADDHLFLA